MTDPTNDGREAGPDRWEACYETGTDVHVRPLDDVTAHPMADDCPCGPTAEPVRCPDGTIGWLVTHHSLDGRERYE